MKIVLSADYFYPSQMGGPSNSIYWLAKALKQAGHDVTVVATSQALQSVPTNTWVTLDCGRVIYTQNPHAYLPIKHIWYGWQAIQNANIVHVNSFFYPASVVWVLMCRIRNKPVIWTPHGELNPAVLAIKPFRKWLILLLVKLARPKFCFHAASAPEAAYIRQHFGADAVVHIIRNRLEIPALLMPESVDTPYLLFIGRLHPVKAIDRLLKAVSTSPLFLEGNFRLLIAGPEAHRAYVRTLKQLVVTLGLSAKVSFIGFVSGAQKQQLYASALLTILPSHTESFGNVVIESLAQGTPVIASINTPWQLLETERVGAWISNNPDPLRRAIERYLVMSSDEYQGYRKRAVEIAQRTFSISDSIDEWSQVYDQQIHSN
ncbi:glycosyltransferase [Spirosoma aerolatum]|uniref:glycosyltransferase n=1 Tax=Spirosoma aerolatum TaxID=1211326 RepID=UPI0009AD23F9|nr:glycosyltransferase [Spirosoma aerolatum]